jgi:hypothetical protein
MDSYIINKAYDLFIFPRFDAVCAKENGNDV